MIIPTLLAAALGFNLQNKVITPGLGKNVVVRTNAYLADGKPGKYTLQVFTNKEDNTPGALLTDIRVSPSNLFLRDNKPRPVTISFPTSSLKPGALWICIMEAEDKKKRAASGSSVTVLTRSCYQRILQLRKPLFGL